MKLRLLEPGFETFTGNFGHVEFERGVSVQDVTDIQAQRIAGLVRAETLEGVNPSSAQLVLDSRTISMRVEPELTRGDPEKPADGPPVPAAPGEAPATYSREQLEAIADARGIAGLREVGDAWGVKAASITKLIHGILEAQSGGKRLSVDERKAASDPLKDAK